MLLIVISTIAAVMEVVGVASILPFIAVVADKSLIESNEILQWLFETLGFTNKNWFLVGLGSGLLVVFLATNAFNALVMWATFRFGWGVQNSVSRRLLTNYVMSPYAFFLTRNPSELSSKVLTESTTVVMGTIIAGTKVISRAMAAVFVVGLLVVIDPLVASVAITVLGGAYAVLFWGIRASLGRLGEKRFRANAARFKATSEVLSGIKDVKLLGAEPFFLENFGRVSRTVAYTQATIATVTQLPRFALASVAFGGLLLLVLLLLATDQRLTAVLPIVGLYAFAGYRLLPAIQDIFVSLSNIKSTAVALDALDAELHRSEVSAAEHSVISRASGRLPLTDRLELNDVSFSYPGSDAQVVSGLDLVVAAGSSVGIVGGTGAGKTTIIDLILGLLEPSGGSISVDGVLLDGSRRGSWQRNVGYVQQNIYLADATIAENVAFGISHGEIDMDRVRQVAEVAQMGDFVGSLPEGFDTEVGDRGVRLSGGQRQRIGIARALYREPALLVLDEATNSLDGITESRVLESLAQDGARTTLSVAHRIKAVRDCDVIYIVEGGAIVAAGTYAELIASSAVFQAMVGQSDEDTVS